LVAADNAVGGENQRHCSGLLRVRAPGDLGNEIVPPLGPAREPVLDERFDVLRVTQGLEIGDSMGVVSLLDEQLPVP
jgi:hypothetical protein